MAKQFSFKGDGASQETVVFGNTFPVDKFVTPEGLTDAQVKILLGHPMFVSQDEAAPIPVVEPDPVVSQQEPPPVVEPEPTPDPAPAKSGK